MSHHQTRPIVPLFAGPLLANIAAWGWAWTAFAGRPVLLGTALLAWVFGLRHALDADHIAAIDNVVRRQMQARARPMSIGMGFSLGHATVVVVASLALALTLALTGRAIAEPGIVTVTRVGVSGGGRRDLRHEVVTFATSSAADPVTTYTFQQLADAVTFFSMPASRSASCRQHDQNSSHATRCKRRET